MAGVSGRPESRSQARTVSPWLARATASTRAAGRVERLAPSGEDGVEQLLRVLLDGAGLGMRGVDGDLGEADHSTVVDDDRLRSRRPLVDRQDPHVGILSSQPALRQDQRTAGVGRYEMTPQEDRADELNAG